jgi:hypothetical protein
MLPGSHVNVLIYLQHISQPGDSHTYVVKPVVTPVYIA